MLAVGDPFGRYVIEAVLGEGGMGRVYRAKDTVLGRPVALKILRADRTDAVARVVREARAVAALGHPNVVAVFDAGEEGGVAYLAMEYLDGKTLRAYVGDASISSEERLRWVTDVARALAAAHASGIVHRDVKPENVVVLRDGTVKVLDFGIARRATGEAREARELDAAAIATLTTTGGIVGTPRYMAPEQMLGDPIDGRADQFAWGVLAYELFTGTSPWGDAGEAVQVVARVLSSSRAPMITREGVPPGLAAVVERAIAREPDDRFAHMSEVVTALVAVASGEPLVLPPSRRRRRRLTWALAGVAAAIAVAATFAIRTASTRRAAAPASSAASLPHRAITYRDLPPPQTASPEALEHFRRAMRDNHDAVSKAHSELQQAVKLDPDFAAAQLHLAFVTGWPSSRAPMREAVRLRDRLDERDQGLLHAYEPLYLESPVDAEEAERRMTALHAARPTDVEITWMLGGLRRAKDLDAARALYEEALALDPTYAAAEGSIAGILERQGRSDEALERYTRCVRIAPDATSCMLQSARLHARRGECADFAEGLRNALALDGDEFFTLKTQLAAFLATSASREEVDALVTRTLDTPLARAAAPQMQDEERTVERGIVALWFGSMPEARDAFEKLSATRAEKTRADVYFGERLAIAEEMGDETRVQTLTRSYATARASQLEGALDGVALRALREHLGASAADVAKLRQRWFGKPPEGTSPVETHNWISYWATPATSKDEALAALEQRARYTLVPESLAARDVAAIGHLYLVAEQYDEAARWLERAATSCQPIVTENSNSYIPAILRAAFELGRAREGLHDGLAACAAYARVLARWGNATPRSTTADRARARMRALGCAP